MAIGGSASALALALAMLAGCASRGGAPPPSTPRAKAAVVQRAPGPLPFVHDDYPRALAEAKRTGRLLFVDAWAPWCHSCQSMRAYVLTDPALAPLAERFVWLSIDTEREQNGPFVARFTHDALPTLWVIDPEREAPVLKWGGTATALELAALLDIADAARQARGSASAETASDALRATMSFVRANQAAARGDLAAAEAGYTEALAAAAPAHPHRARIVEALVGALAARKQARRCAEIATAEASDMPPGTSRATVLAAGLECARDAGARRELDALLVVADRAVLDPDPRTLADDRSGIFEQIVETRQALGDAAGAKQAARAWALLLEAEVSRAPDAAARAVFDAHRLGAYLAMGEPERALPMLERSERDFPDDYNPPARLARALFEMRRFDDARAAVDRARARVYGPRALRVLALAADIARARGDVAAERAALEDALSRTEHAVLTPGQATLRGSLASRLRALRP